MNGRLALLFVVFLVGCSTHKNSVLRDFTYDGRKCAEAENFFRYDTKSNAPIKVYFEEGSHNWAANTLRTAKLSYQSLRKFFEFDVRTDITFYILNETKSLDQFNGDDNDEWVVSFAATANDIAILNPQSWTPQSRVGVKFDKLIYHEMVHAFLIELRGGENRNCVYGNNKDEGKFWLDEGFATFLSGQIEDWRYGLKSYDFEKHGRFADSLSKASSYVVSATAAEFLLKTLGKEKLLNLFKNLPHNYMREENKAQVEAYLVRELGGIEKYQELEAAWIDFVKKKYL